MKVLGIDPGLKGGLGFYDGTTLVAYRMPLTKEPYVRRGKKSTRDVYDLAKINEILIEEHPDYAALEKVSSRPGEGSTSSFRFGQGVGQLQGLLVANRILYTHPTPQLWKRHYEITSDKDDSLSLAKEMWPEHADTSFKYKRDDGVAEAALIAAWLLEYPDLMVYPSI